MLPGRHYDTISVWGSELEDQKIDEINEIEFSLKCHDSDTYDDIWDAGTITITIIAIPKNIT